MKFLIPLLELFANLSKWFERKQLIDLGGVKEKVKQYAQNKKARAEKRAIHNRIDRDDVYAKFVRDQFKKHHK